MLFAPLGGRGNIATGSGPAQYFLIVSKNSSLKDRGTACLNLEKFLHANNT